MKLNLPTVEDLKQFNIRLPEGLKGELTELREQCDRDHLDFNAALTSNPPYLRCKRPRRTRYPWSQSG
jgi:hypothetical protein